MYAISIKATSVCMPYLLRLLAYVWRPGIINEAKVSRIIIVLW